MNIPGIKTKDLISVLDLTRDEIFDLFRFTAKLKIDLARRKKQKYLEGKTLAMVFEKSSTRTRVSFETGIYQLGGHALFLDSNDIQIGRGETISDTAKVLSRYVDAVMFRTSSHSKAIELAKNASIPVINGLSDKTHPCQALADYYSIYERENDFSKIKLAYIGDSNNVSNSLMFGAAVLGIEFSIACPKKYIPDRIILKEAENFANQSGAKIQVTDNIDDALKDANFLYTDVWVSMGQEDRRSKKKALAKYKISNRTLGKCSDNCLVMHCLPAKRGEEIDSDVMDSEKSIIFDQAENRLHVQKAILCSLLKDRG